MSRKIENGFGCAGYGPLSQTERDLERAFDDLHQAKGQIVALEREVQSLHAQLAAALKDKERKVNLSKSLYEGNEGHDVDQAP